MRGDGVTDLAAFEEDVAVALEVVAGRAGPEAEALRQLELRQPARLHPLLGGLDKEV